MKGNLETCIRLTFGDEGGYVNHPKDPGGPTKYGITLRTLAAYRRTKVTATDVKEMKIGEATVILEQQYWRRIWGDELPKGVDYCIFDFAVNSGPAQAIKVAQRLVGVDHDGAMGALTLQALEEIPPGDFIAKYQSARLDFLHGLDTWSTFGKGWSSRVAHVRVAALAMLDKRGSILTAAKEDGLVEKEGLHKAPPSATTTISTSPGKTSLGTVVAGAVTTAATGLTPFADVPSVKTMLVGLAIVSAVLALIGGLVAWNIERRKIENGAPV